MILIVGATGLNGREVLRLLTSTGHRVRALVRNPEKAKDMKENGVEVVKGDLGNPGSLDAALKGIRKAFVVAPVDHHAATWLINFIEAARRAGTSHVVKFSVMGADSHSTLEIPRQHGGTDQLLIRSGVGYTILRPNAFFQNVLTNAQSVRNDGKLFQAINHARVSMVDIRDIAEVAFRALTTHGHIGKTYTLTGPEAVSYDDIANRLSTITTHAVRSVYVAPEEMRKTMVAGGMPEWNAHAVAGLFGGVAEGKFGAVTEDIEHVLGRRARSMDDFLRDFGRAFW